MHLQPQLELFHISVAINPHPLQSWQEWKIISGPERIWCSFLFYKGSVGRFSLGASGKEKMKITNWREGREGTRDRGKVMGRRGEAKEGCRSWQGGEPSNKYSRYSQCAEINDVISAWIDVCTVPLKGALSINHITIPPTACARTRTRIHTFTLRIHTNTHTPQLSQLVWIKMYGCKVSVSRDHYVNVFFQLSSPITMQMVGGTEEEINLLR